MERNDLVAEALAVLMSCNTRMTVNRWQGTND